MATVKFRNSLLGIRKLNSKSRNAESQSSFFTIPEDTSSIGEVIYCGPESEELLGKTVYFGNPIAEIRIQGTPIQILELKNVFATVEESASPSSESK